MNDTAQRQVPRQVAETKPAAHQDLSAAVHQLRGRSQHSDSALTTLRAQEQNLMAQEAALEQRAHDLLAEIRDCQKALSVTRDSMSRLSR